MYYSSAYTEPWVSYVEDNGEVKYNKFEGEDYLMMPLTFDIISAGTIYWKKCSSDGETRTIQYTKNNGQTWTNITSSTAGTSFNVSAGDKVMFRGNNEAYSFGDVRCNCFCGTTAVFEVYGNIMSLIDSTGFTSALTLTGDYTFYGLFEQCTGLTSAENLMLPATALTIYCYRELLARCTNLTESPKKLPAKTMTNNCYSRMFSGCTNLVTTPTLPAKNLDWNCYGYMFGGCTSLTTGPVLPATEIATYAYQFMFFGCSSLSEAPKLPATSLNSLCYYYMFGHCTSLTTAPELPALTLPDRCYMSMFYGCTSLNYVKCLATKNNSYGTSGWLENVSQTGTFVKDSSMSSWTTGNSGIPTNWTVQDA